MAFVAIGAAVFAFTPLNSIVTQRLSHGQSNSIRSSLDRQAFDAAVKSPIVGWGTTRSALGSPTSIGIGKTPSCPTCGNAPIGSTGEIWAVLIANGFVGAILFLGFPLIVAWRYRFDDRPEGRRLAADLVSRAVLFAVLRRATDGPELDVHLDGHALALECPERSAVSVVGATV